MDIRSNVIIRFICLTFCVILVLHVVYDYLPMLQKLDTKVSTTDPKISIKSIHNVLNTLSHYRLRLAKLDAKLKLYAILLWMVIPSSPDRFPGAQWYNALWERNEFDGTKELDYMMSLKPCKDYKDVFIQIGHI